MIGRHWENATHPKLVTAAPTKQRAKDARSPATARKLPWWSKNRPATVLAATYTVGRCVAANLDSLRVNRRVVCLSGQR
jgi:hypothetical protein